MGDTLHDPIPDLTGKVAIVTGGHTGLGFGTSIELAKHGARVYIASRSAAKFNDAEREIRLECPEAQVRFILLDLADLSSVQAAAERFSHTYSLQIMCIPYEETKQGFELQIGVGRPACNGFLFLAAVIAKKKKVNYIGHFLFTELLIPILQRTAERAERGSVRVVNVSSDGHAKLAPKEGIIFSDMNMKDGFSVWARYGHSKLANVLHSKALAKRFPSILSLSLHPGTVKTYAAVSFPVQRFTSTNLTILRNLSAGPISSTPLYRLIKPLVELGAPGPRKGAANILFAAVSSRLRLESDNGAYLLPIGRVSAPSKAASDLEMAEELWKWTTKTLRSRGY
ncbi:retinol dehydrogenase [Aspergillus costaricaensis CBS 115574]|uniref:Retinol dehydrogenase n=1 Tax=Aspergillus costaricaensis CBS 115574 TaxID=1448317 RepID=A0ACD1IB69_9EURO|nr:retinol dehydrogenase [Aspergillus costaricaensis CBS 115574]RAK87824.1 retinol dehydrogenase [Aspergillus costaricaensis CBS 115574]